MIKTQTLVRTVAAVFLFTVISISCKKDSNTTTPITVSGSASASATIGSAAVAVSFSSATFTNTSGTVDVVATNTAGQKLTLHVTGVTATGTYNLTGSNSGVFVNGSLSYTTVGSGGGNVIITTLSTDKVEGTFLVEAFAASVYCGLNAGKFTAGK